MVDCLGLDFSRFQIVTFDCYGTLIDWEAGILGALRPILSAHGAHLADAELLRWYGDIESQLESGAYRPYKEILRAVVRGFGDRLGFVATSGEEQSLAKSLPRWAPFADTVAALRRLQTKFKLGILSNVDDDLFSATAPWLEVHFDHVITAAQAHAYKPSLEVFRLALSRIELPPEGWLHAAQSLYHDVIPARSLGISTAWVNRPSLRPGAGAAKPASANPDATVTGLAELADLAC
jgi:2-haloacid dehalogenase